MRTLQIYLGLVALGAGLGETRLRAAELRFEDRDLAFGKGEGSLRILERRLILAKCRGRLLLHQDGSQIAVLQQLLFGHPVGVFWVEEGQRCRDDEQPEYGERQGGGCP